MRRRPRSRRAWTWLLVSGLLIAGALAPVHAQSEGEVAVVIHPGVPLDNISVSELRRLLLGDREFWPGSVRVTLLIRAPVAHERDVVLKEICQMSEAQFRQHWIAKVFRAEAALAPKITYSNEMAVDLVSRIPGAITFVDVAQVTKGTKVVKVDGRLPGQEGYVLR
jgi:phosphate transport system substrate-binding protein